MRAVWIPKEVGRAAEVVHQELVPRLHQHPSAPLAHPIGCGAGRPAVHGREARHARVVQVPLVHDLLGRLDVVAAQLHLVRVAGDAGAKVHHLEAQVGRGVKRKEDDRGYELRRPALRLGMHGGVVLHEEHPLVLLDVCRCDHGAHHADLRERVGRVGPRLIAPEMEMATCHWASVLEDLPSARASSADSQVREARGTNNDGPAASDPAREVVHVQRSARDEVGPHHGHALGVDRRVKVGRRQVPVGFVLHPLLPLGKRRHGPG
mmetsp:Transcript_24204/g.81378  ORF Transcript_24204/g.81378 Transcript_24204/m.81378 type:complete len:264 (+) Transcript_24204:301-1092(+)